MFVTLINDYLRTVACWFLVGKGIQSLND